MQSNLLFVSVFNHGVIEMAKNHLQSLRIQGHTNTLCFVTDKMSADVLAELKYPYIYVSETDITSDNKDFGTTAFNQMSYLRYYCIHNYMKQNANTDIWYMDVDTVVLKNLNDVYANAKLQNLNVCFQSDVNMACTGCMLLFASDKTTEFVASVFNNRTQNTNDQILVKFLLNEFPNIIRYGLFAPEQFPCGVLYFNEDFVSPPEYVRQYRAEIQQKMQANAPAFVHANWMIGDEKKTAAMKKHGLWFL